MENSRETFVKKMTNYLIGVRNNFGEDEVKPSLKSEFDDDFIEEYAEFLYDSVKTSFDDLGYDGTLWNIYYSFQSFMSEYLYANFE